jgi:hypothetical protein
MRNRLRSLTQKLPEKTNLSDFTNYRFISYVKTPASVVRFTQIDKSWKTAKLILPSSVERKSRLLALFVRLHGARITADGVRKTPCSPTNPVHVLGNKAKPCHPTDTCFSNLLSTITIHPPICRPVRTAVRRRSGSVYDIR